MRKCVSALGPVVCCVVIDMSCGVKKNAGGEGLGVDWMAARPRHNVH